MELTEAMRSYVEKKIARLHKRYNRISEVEVVVDGDGQNHKTEIIVKVDNHQPFVVRHSSDDAYSCVDAAVDKIERQLTRFKEKSRDRKGRAGMGEAAVDVLKAQGSEMTEDE